LDSAARRAIGSRRRADAARYLGERRAVAIGLDAPFIDPVREGMLQGKAGPAPGTPAGLPFAVHHHLRTQVGIHHVENAKLDEMARDKVWTSCTLILPLREKGAAGSAIRPVAIGVPIAVARKSGSGR
jgi:kynurenine formamidase